MIMEFAMGKKLALAILLATVSGVASADYDGGDSDGRICKTEYFWGIFPYQVCTTPKTVVAAPEIDAASAVAGLTLMIGGLAVLRGRRNKSAKA
jgi:hypothetical protein